MDEDNFRRNSPTVHKQVKDYYLKTFKETKYDGELYSRKSSRFAVSFGIMLANIANILSKYAIQKSSFSKELKYNAIKILEKADQLIYHGQMLDLLMENQTRITEKAYFEMTKLKTAELFGIAFQLGSMFAESDTYFQYLFKEFGIKTAIAFQIQDDILDLSRAKGHEPGSDIKKGKKTLLMIKTLENSSPTNRKLISRIFAKANATDSEVKAVSKVMYDTGAITYCKKIALKYADEAKVIIEKLNIPEHYKHALIDYSDYLGQRSY